MHELSIATSVLTAATDLACQHGASRVLTITLRIGRLSCVHEEALRYSFDLIRAGTPSAEATLTIIPVPVRIWCPSCQNEQDLPGIQHLVCPTCGTRTGDIRAGRELDIESITLDTLDTPDDETTDGNATHS